MLAAHTRTGSTLREVIARGFERLALWQVFAAIFASGIVYGGVMGSYAGIFDGGALQVLYSALKVPLLLTATFALALPSFFVLNTLAGLRDDFADVLRSIVGAQAVLALILASLTPYTLLWYASTRDYAGAQVFSLAVFALASISGQSVLRHRYRALVTRNPRHAPMRRLWLVLYAFVGVQTAWVLRPFIGRPGQSTEFLRQDSWSNAYELVGEIVIGAFTR
jgi:hypothetical protein